jgi:uncharacterized HAD superfamily protein
MKVGVDIDDVITETFLGLINFINKKYGRNHTYGGITSYNLWEIGIGSDKSEAIKLVEEFFDLEGDSKSRLIEGSIAALESIHCSGDEIFIITSRPLSIRSQTDSFLKGCLGNIPYQVFYSGDFYGQGKTKVEICNELGIDLMIEDCLDYAEGFENQKVCLLDKPWNQKDNLPSNVIRVFNWQEILDKIGGLKNG